MLRPEVFSDLAGVAAGFSTRHGGVSRGRYRSLNLGLSTDDAGADVAENRRRLASYLGFQVEDLAVAGQVHGARVKHVDAPGLYPGFDAMVTRTDGLLLCISSADCAAVLLADAGAGVIGAAHSGWRGTEQGIVGRTIAAMTAAGARPERIRAYVGPSISVHSFEVGPEVAARFDDRYVVRRPEWPGPHVDLKAAIRDQLVGAGVPPENVEVSPHCTYTETDRFFSHRAEEGVTGRMMGVIGRRAGGSNRA